MKSPLAKRCGLFAFLLGQALSLFAAATSEEAALAVLQSGAGEAEKSAACLQLKSIATARAVPALAALLADEKLAQHALNALETLPAPEAGTALIKALDTAPKPTKAGIIHALGLRREKAAVAKLAALLADNDSLVAARAAMSLGRIGGDEALSALRQVKDSAPQSVRLAAADALLTIAEQLQAAGQLKQAASIYERIQAAYPSGPLRIAAFRGLARCAGNQAPSLLLAALTGSEAEIQPMAVELARDWPGPEATAALAAALSQAPEPLQAALLEALVQRGDPSAASAVTALLKKRMGVSRTAALKALGELGDASHLALLADNAASGSPEDRQAARQALASLSRGDLLGSSLALMRDASPSVQIEMIPILARHGGPQAVNTLLVAARSGAPDLEMAALRALEKLLDSTQAGVLLDLVRETRHETTREAAANALAAVAARSPRPSELTAAILKAREGAGTAARAALYSAAGRIGGPGVLPALRQGLRDSEPAVRKSALTALIEHGGPAVLPDLLELGRAGPDETVRVLAVRGYFGVANQLKDHAPGARLAAIKDGLAVASTPAARKLGLAGLAELDSAEALALAQSYTNEPNVRAEAESAMLRIAARLWAADRAAAHQAMETLSQSALAEQVRQEAANLIQQRSKYADYLCDWLVSGPYRQKGAEARQLFDLPFAPEKPEGAADWRRLPPAVSPTNFWLAELDQVVGGDHCVVYLKTKVYSPRAEKVNLAIGSDDGIKLWVNGRLVHANNAVRGFTPGQDQAKAELNEGWNEFLAKVTQHTLGCAAAIRIRRADGSPLSELRVQAIK